MAVDSITTASPFPGSRENSSFLLSYAAAMFMMRVSRGVQSETSLMDSISWRVDSYRKS